MPVPAEPRPQAAQAAPAPKPAPPAQSAPRTSAGDPQAEAYYQFIVGRHLESEGDADGALAAYKRALALDPASAEIYAELATHYVRRNDIAAATAAAEAALKNDPENVEAHRLLGMISADKAESDDDAAAARPAAQEAARTAIDHLEKALKGSTIDAAIGIRLALGRLYLQTRQADRAVGLLRQALVDEPGLPQAVALLVEAYKASNQHDAAIDLLKEAVRDDPSFYGSLADAYEKEKRWPEAASAYERASAFSPRNADLKTRWAQALLNAGDDASVKRARDLLIDVTRTNPTSAWPLYLLARAQRQTGDLDGAEHSARRLLALSPTSVSGAHALAQVLAQRRDFPGVIAALAPVVDRLPAGRDADRALLLTHLGFAYLETNRLPESVAAFERALALDPGDRAVPVYLGQALNTSKQFDKALVLARDLRTANPNDVRLARVEADALRGQGKVDEGAAVLKAFADGPSAPVEAVQALGEFYASARRYAEAADLLKRAALAHPDDVGVLFQYAAMLERQKITAEAERVFRQVLAKDPDHASAMNYLGYMFVERGERLQEALALIQRAVGLEPYNGAYLDSLGWAYFRMGKLDEAEKHLRVAAGQLPRDSVVQDHWGDLLTKRGRHAEAVAAWKLALAGDGESIDRAAIERKVQQALDKQK
jgi:tetratricopeptide (TPR) repeat protein